MLQNILLHYPKEASSAKLYFPYHILDALNWKVDTPLIIEELGINNFGISIHRNMKKGRIYSYLTFSPLYRAPYLHVYRIKNIARTLPINCSHLISNTTYPPKLNIMIPQYLKMFNYESMFEESEPITA